MADEADNMVLQLLRTMRADNTARFDQIEARFDDIEAVLREVRLTVTGHDLRFDALEERVETIREGTDSRPKGAMSDGVAVTDPLAYWRSGHGAKGV